MIVKLQESIIPKICRLIVLKAGGVPIETMFQRIVISKASSQVHMEGSCVILVVHGAYSLLQV